MQSKAQLDLNTLAQSFRGMLYSHYLENIIGNLSLKRISLSCYYLVLWSLPSVKCERDHSFLQHTQICTTKKLLLSVCLPSDSSSSEQFEMSDIWSSANSGSNWKGKAILHSIKSDKNKKKTTYQETNSKSANHDVTSSNHVKIPQESQSTFHRNLKSRCGKGKIISPKN